MTLPRQPMTKEQLTAYMTMLRDCRRGGMAKDIGKRESKRQWHYAGMEDFILRHGEWFDAPEKSCSWLGTPQACFANARAAARVKGWTYVEGYANFIIPVHHAWCVDPQGQVQEVTWETPGNLYYGVKFEPTPKTVMFDNWTAKDGMKIYKKPWRPKRISKIKLARGSRRFDPGKLTSTPKEVHAKIS